MSGADEFAGVGFAPGVVRGSRAFGVDKLGRLTGVVHRQVWRPGENDAECRKTEDPYAIGGYVTVAQQMVQQLSYSYNRPYTWSSIPTSYSLTSKSRKQITEPESTPEPAHSYEKCACGFYGYYDASNDYYQDDRVNGIVEGYGETVIGTRGFRAMKARIVALHVPESVVDRYTKLVGRNYPDIPFFTSFKDMVSEFPPDGGVKAVSPDTDPDFWIRSV
jgi:hypothetical protein